MTQDKSPFEIDIYALDKEWLAQPKLAMEIGQNAAWARENLDAAKTRLEMVKAEVTMRVHKNPEKYGLSGKPTVQQTNTVVTLHKKVKEAEEHVIQASKQSNTAMAAVSAIEHKRRALENLVVLHGRDYYSEPRDTEGNGNYGQEAKARAANTAVKRELNKGKKNA
jgi:hypothetical protein